MTISSHYCGDSCSATMLVSVQFTRLEGPIEAAASRYTLQDRGTNVPWHFKFSSPVLQITWMLSITLNVEAYSSLLHFAQLLAVILGMQIDAGLHFFLLPQ